MNLLILYFHLSFFISFQSDWTKTTADDGSFEIYAPGMMDTISSEIKTELGNLKLFTYSYKGDKEDNNYLYLINYCNYPEGTFHQDSILLIEDFLSESIQSSLESLNGKLSYSSDIQIFNNPGKLYRIHYNKGEAVVKSKIYLVDDRFYSLQVFTLKDRSLNDDMDNFLDSFKLLY